MDHTDLELRRHLKNWTARQPLPGTGRADLLRAAQELKKDPQSRSRAVVELCDRMEYCRPPKKASPDWEQSLRRWWVKRPFLSGRLTQILRTAAMMLTVDRNHMPDNAFGNQIFASQVAALFSGEQLFLPFTTSQLWSVRRTTQHYVTT